MENAEARDTKQLFQWKLIKQRANIRTLKLYDKLEMIELYDNNCINKIIRNGIEFFTILKIL